MPTTRRRHVVTETDKVAEAVARTSGTLAGSYCENYLDSLREDWPG